MASNRAPHHLVFLLIQLLLLEGLLASAMLTVSYAQITLDGSLGPSGSLTGPLYVIGAEVGQTRGSNLFHSFGQFNVLMGESATFTGPSSIANIVGRVTGGQQSFIDGWLRSAIPGANLFLLNPSGVLFGPNAMLDVSGSFHASTADYLGFADGAKFFANLSENSVLTVAPPAAFGFLGNNPAAIAFQGSSLYVPDGKTLSVIGGDIQMISSRLEAPGGRIQIASVASPGEVIPSTWEQAPDLRMDSFTRLGRIELSQDVLLDVRGNVGGTVLIRSGQLLVDQSGIFADTRGNTDGARTGVDIKVVEDLVLTNESIIASWAFRRGRAGDIVLDVGHLTVNGSVISANTLDGGQGSDVIITARDSVGIFGLGQLSSMAFGSGNVGRIVISAPTVILDTGKILTSTLGAGRGGDIELHVGRLTLTGGGLIDSSTVTGGAGGTVTITATDSITISGRLSGPLPLLSSVTSLTGSSGDAGRIVISAPTVIVDGGLISTSTLGAGRGGEIEVRAGRLTLTGGGAIQSNTNRGGPGGTVTITATDSIFISGSSPLSGVDRSGIFSLTLGSGNAGQTSVSTPLLIMDNGGAISADTGGDGHAGNVSVHVGNLSLGGGARIASGSGLVIEDKVFLGAGDGGAVMVIATDTITISGAGSGIFSNTLGLGRGGSVHLEAKHIQLSNGGIISASSSGVGDAGNIVIQASESFVSQNGAVATESERADGGNIQLTAGSLVHLTGSQLTATVKGGEGRGGNIAIDSRSVVLDGSQVRADAFGGPGGNVRIVAGVLLASPDSVVSASSVLGIAGTVDIRAPITTLSGTLAPLPEAFLSATALLPARCAARVQGGKYSSLVLRGRNGLPRAPGGLSLSPLALSERMVANPALPEERRRHKPTSRFALLDFDDKALPRIRMGNQPAFSQTALVLGCSR